MPMFSRYHLVSEPIVRDGQNPPEVMELALIVDEVPLTTACVCFIKGMT